MDKVTKVKDELTELEATISLSLSKISKDEMEKMRKMRYIYRNEKHAEDEATPSSVRNGANGNSTRVLGIKCIAAQ